MEAVYERIYNQHSYLQLFGLFLIYPSVSSDMMRIFRCETVYEQLLLTADVNIECGVGFWNVAAVFGAVGLLCYTLGIPALFYWMLWRERDALDTQRVKNSYGFLYDDYKYDEGLWGFESALMLYKAALTFVVIFLHEDSSTQVIATFTVAIAFYCFSLYARAFSDPYDDLLHCTSVASIAVTTFTAVLLQHAEELRQVAPHERAAYDIGAITALLLMANVGVLALFACMVGVFLVQQYTKVCQADDDEADEEERREGEEAEGREEAAPAERSPEEVAGGVYPPQWRSQELCSVTTQEEEREHDEPPESPRLRMLTALCAEIEAQTGGSHSSETEVELAVVEVAADRSIESSPVQELNVETRFTQGFETSHLGRESAQAQGQLGMLLGPPLAMEVARVTEAMGSDLEGLRSDLEGLRREELELEVEAPRAAAMDLYEVGEMPSAELGWLPSGESSQPDSLGNLGNVFGLFVDDLDDSAREALAALDQELESTSRLVGAEAQEEAEQSAVQVLK